MAERILALASLTLDYIAPPDIVHAAAEVGFGWVSLHITAPGRPQDEAFDLLGDTPLIRATQHALTETGVSVLDVEALKIRPETRAAEYETYFETAARLGARLAQAMSLDPDEARSADTFAAICALAEPYGVRVALEFTVLFDIKTLDQAIHFARRAAHPAAGVLLDTLHFSRSGGVPSDVTQSDWDRLFYIPVCDAPAERPTTREGRLAAATSDRLFPGQGDLELRGLFDSLPRDIPVSVECPVRSAADLTPRAKAELAYQTTTALLGLGARGAP
jgi:sugar phosphate isomerase/epimerase